MHVDIEDKIKMKELMPAQNGLPLNSQPHTIFINQSGLYSLILSSKMEKHVCICGSCYCKDNKAKHEKIYQ